MIRSFAINIKLVSGIIKLCKRRKNVDFKAIIEHGHIIILKPLKIKFYCSTLVISDGHRAVKKNHKLKIT